MKNRRSILCLLLAITLLLSQLPLSSTAVKAGEGDQYTVTYMDGDTVISTAEVESGQKAPIPEIPVKSGYGFFGWHSDSALTVRYDFNEPVTGNLTLYALFLPEVTGLTLHTEGAEKKDGGYALKADTLTVTFHTDAVPADLDKLELTALYSDKELTTLLTKYPGADTVAYFSVNMAAGSDEAPVVFWGDGLKTNCVLEAADGTIEFVELLRSPNSGSAMVICKYTCTRATVNVTYDANGGTTGDEWISMLQAPYGLTVEGEGFVCEPPSEDAVKAPEGMEFAGIEVGGVLFNAGDPVSFTYDKDLTIKYLWKNKDAETLPEVTGLELHTEGVEEKDGGYTLKVDTLTVTFHTDAVPADLDKLELTSLYTDKELTVPLSTEPVSDTAYYFSVNMAAGSDEAPVVFWGDGLKTNCVLEATDGTIEFVELLVSPNGGSAMVICKYMKQDEAVTYETPDGNTSWTEATGGTLKITVKRSVADDTCFSHFVGVKLDGKELKKETDYTAAPGSTVITLNTSLLETLEEGKHTVVVIFDDGEVTTEIEIKSAPSNTEEDTNPKTGDRNDLGLWTALMMLSMVLIVCMGVYTIAGRKKGAHS